MNHDQIIDALRGIQEGYTLTYTQKVALAWCVGKLMLPRPNTGACAGQREDLKHGQESK